VDAKYFVILGVVPDPVPYQNVVNFHSQGAMAHADSGRPETPRLLQMEGGMAGIVFEQLEAFVSQVLHLFRKSVVSLPEL